MSVTTNVYVLRKAFRNDSVQPNANNKTKCVPVFKFFKSAFFSVPTCHRVEFRSITKFMPRLEKLLFKTERKTWNFAVLDHGIFFLINFFYGSYAMQKLGWDAEYFPSIAHGFGDCQLKWSANIRLIQVNFIVYGQLKCLAFQTKCITAETKWRRWKKENVRFKWWACMLIFGWVIQTINNSSL